MLLDIRSQLRQIFADFSFFIHCWI